MMPLHTNLIFDHEYYVVEIVDWPANLYECLEDWFGPAGKRWFWNGTRIYFRDEKDYFWFELKT